MGTEAKTKGDVRHLDHFVLAVMDADRAEKFYTEILGARTLKRFDSPNMNRVFMKLGENHVGLFSQGKTTLPKRESAASYPRHSFVVPEDEFESMAAKIRRASPFVKEIQKKRDWVVAGTKDWSSRTPRETFWKSPKPKESAGRASITCTSTPRTWRPASVFTRAS